MLLLRPEGRGERGLPVLSRREEGRGDDCLGLKLRACRGLETRRGLLGAAAELRGLEAGGFLPERCAFPPALEALHLLLQA